MSREERDLSPNVAAIGLLSILFFAALVRIRLLDLPLERDEGEYAYAGQLILQGIPPYRFVYNMKFPGTYAAYAAIMALFGETPAGIRFGLLLVTSATTLVVYFLAARLYGRKAGLVAAFCQALLSLSPAAVGPMAHATHFAVLPGIAGFLLLLPKGGKKQERAGEAPAATLLPPPTLPPPPTRLFLAGVLFGVAVFMKQPAITFLGCAVLYLLYSRHVRDGAIVAGGAAAVAAVAFVVLSAAGVFPRFWFWTISYAREYATTTPLSVGLESFREHFGPILSYSPLLWLTALIGLVIVILDKNRDRRWAVLVIVAACFLATVPGLYFRPHYFLIAMPAVALLVAGAFEGARRLAPPVALSIATAVILLISVVQQSYAFMGFDDRKLIHALYAFDPVLEAPRIADYVRQHTGPGDSIAILGSQPEIYFYSGRRSATGYIYMYPLMEKQKFARQMQGELIGEVTRADPRYLLVVSTQRSWGRTKDSDPAIFEWVQRVVQGYQLEGVVEVFADRSVYSWGDEARRYRPSTPNIVTIYRRL